MRQGGSSAVLAGGACLLAGCGPDCAAPSAVDGQWDVFANVVTWTIDGDAEAFPAGSSPANGAHVWDFAFDPSGETVTIRIDDQSFAGESLWETLECGQFSLRLFGTFLGPVGASHVFETRGDFLTFGDEIEGRWGWSEAWTTADGSATGSFEAQGQVRGHRSAEGED